MVDRAAVTESNWRSTLMTGMPAFIAFCATGVSAAPSKGRSTMASTFWLMKVSTWLICVLTSFVPSATLSLTSLYLSACAFAPLVIAAIQPWSAAGAEKPMVTVLPVSSLLLAALLPPQLLELSGVLLVQPATRPAAPTTQTAVVIRRRNGRCLVADMLSPRVIASLAGLGQVVGGAAGGRAAVRWCGRGAAVLRRTRVTSSGRGSWAHQGCR